MRRTSGSKAETYYFKTDPRDLVMGMPHFLLLSCVGLFISAQAQDCERPIGGPNMDLSSTHITQDTFPDGTRVRFVCDLGYEPVEGTGTITCTAGSWSSLTLKCDLKSCGGVETVPNGDVLYPTGNDFGDIATIICKKGFSLVGSNTRKCTQQGWSGRNPVCEVVRCDMPKTIKDGSFSPQPNRDDGMYEYLNAVTYQCNKGFTIVGPATVTCNENGIFHPGSPECRNVSCQDPEIENGQWAGGSRPPHGHQATVTLMCNEGYSMIGQPTVVCGINNTWTPELPKCEKQTTSRPTTTTTSTTTTTTTIAVTPKINPESGAPAVKVVVIIIVVLLLLVVAIIVFVIYRKRTGTRSASKVDVGRKDKEDEEAMSLSGTRKNVDQASGGTGMEMKD